MSTIYGKSNHPVFVKKINLSTWTLRDEIEALIAEKLKSLGKTSTDNLTDQEIADIKNFYLARISNDTSNVIPFVRKVENDNPNEKINQAVDAVVEAKTDEAPKTEETPKPEGEAAPVDAAAPAEPTAEMKQAMEELAGAQEANLQANNVAGLPAFNKDNTPFRRRPELLDEKMCSPGVLILSDINMEEILFFSKYPFDFGQSVVIEFLIPNYFIMGAEIISCARYNRKSRIINPTRPEYRLKAKFNFQTMGERTLLRNFLKSIAPDVPKTKTKTAVKAEAKDDLSDLGL